MKLLNIEIEGFGPFKDKQVIDFTRFDDHGLFLIAGETGVGKSSILDAITYALYDFTPRWEDTEANAEHKSVRSSYCEPGDPTRVKLTFSLPTGDVTKTYFVERKINGLDKNGAERKPDVSVKELHADGTEQGVASGVVAVRSAISQLVRLDGTEFLQVALLAQGKFEAFLTASSPRRLELIRKLFNTRRFELIQNEIKARKAEVEKEVSESLQHLATAVDGLSQSLEIDAPASGEEVVWLKAQISRFESLSAEKEKDVTEANNAEIAAQKAFDDATTFKELTTLKEEQKQHDSQKEDHKANLAKLKVAEHAAKVSPLFDAYTTARVDEDQARETLEALEVSKDLPTEVGELKTLRSNATKKSGALGPVLETELGLPNAKEASQKLKGEIDDLVLKETETKTEIDALKAERSEIKKVADKLASAEAAYKDAQALAKSFEEFVGLKEQLVEAEGKAENAKSAEEAARSKFESIFRSYSLNAAHRLAVELLPGDDCPVCGSQEHPKKAVATGVDVSEQDLQEAKTALETRMLKHQELAAKSVQLRDEIDDLTETHAGQSGETVKDSVTQAEVKFREAKSAKARFDELSTLLEVGSDFMESYSGLSARIVEMRAEFGAKERELAAAEALVKRSLNGFESVADYKASLESQASELEEVIEAIEALATATSALGKAESKFNKALKEHDFAAQKVFEASVLAEDVLEELKAEIEDYTEKDTRLKTLLGQDKFSALPKKILQIDEAEQALQGATSASKVLISEHGVIKNQLNLIKECQKRVKGIMPILEKQSADLDLHRGLYDALHGLGANTLQMTLETYFAAAELEVILEAANTQLQTMAAGKQFTLVHSDKALKKTGKTGLGIEVIDEHSGGLRNPVTLSGGEKFQVSLAIALGLAQVVSERSGSIRIDTLFVDEGFGSLSKEVLETAMNTLDALKQGGRTIGVISHVDRMQESIPAKLNIAKLPGGPSIVTSIEA